MNFSRLNFLKRWYILFFAIMSALLSSCSENGSTVKEKKYETLSDFNGSVFGSLTGVPYDKMTPECLKDVRWLYYEDVPSTIAALRKGDVDAVILDSPVIRLITTQNREDMIQFPELMSHCDFSLMFRKGSPFTEIFSQEIRKVKADGTLDRLLNKWTSGNDSLMRINWKDYNMKRRSNGILRFAFDPTTVPIAYIGEDQKPCGLEPELILIIADRLDMGVEFDDIRITSLIMSIQQGKADVGGGCLVVTPERMESVDFCESYYSGGTSLMCRKKDVVLKTLNTPSALIAVEVGTTTEAEIRKAFPKAQYTVVEDANNGFMAVTSKKAQAFAVDKATFQSYLETGGRGLKIYKDSVFGQPGKISVGISPKTTFPDAYNKINAFLREFTSNGVLKDMERRWVHDHNYVQPEIPLAQHPAFTLKVGTTGLLEPYSFYNGSELSGFDIELMRRFALWCNADIVFETYEWSEAVSACAAGKVDYLASYLFQTPERKEVIDFSIPYRLLESILVVSSEEDHGAKAEDRFMEKVQESFQKTFIRESRWKMILRGLAVTLGITLGAGILGTILGFLLCLALRSRKKWISAPFKGFTTLMQGIPSLVILMITYFVIFGKADVSPISVGIIAFGVMFAVSVAGILNTGIEAIDRGQWEAAAALGFGQSGTFAHIILPQAVRHILPLYKGEFVSMMQLTSIAGYISIEDLTKVGDIIRSRTYEAFFPLIAIAIIYFALSSIMTYGIGKIEIVIDPRHRPRRLPKGITEKQGTEKEKAPTPELEIQKDLLIHIEHLKKVYPNVIPLKDVNADIHRGEVITIIGPSGTGKSTLMRCINRLETPTEGKVTVFGMDTSDKKTDLRLLRRRAGMVFQSFNLFSHLTVIENIMLAPTLLNHESNQSAYENAMLLLRRVGMAEKMLNYPDELSGGQKQRVAIARALAMNPEIIFFDEPTSALDPTMVGEVLSVIKSLARQGLTLMIVTHEMKFARDVSTRIFYMDQGIIYEDGTPAQIFEAPQKERTRHFIQKLKVLEINIVSPDFDFIEINNRILQYGLKNAIDRRWIFRIQNIFEELCVLTLAPRLGRDVFIRFMLEYSEEESQVRINIRYNGPAFDPLSEGDELSVRMIRGYCSEINHQSPAEDAAFGNEIWITLRK